MDSVKDTVETGCADMSETKKIILSLPEELLRQADAQAEESEISRSEWVRRAIVLSLTQSKRERIRRFMEAGYREMGLLNLQLAEEAVAVDTSDFIIYEKRILESE